MSTLPMQNPNSIPNRLFGVFGDWATAAGTIVASKSLLDIADGEIGVQINPMDGSGRFNVAATKTTGSAAPVSVWQSYDMLFLGVGAVIVLAAVMLRK